MSKAFGKANNKRLLPRLWFLGCIIIQMYIRDRIHNYSFGGTSSPSQVTSWVSRGSILGLVLFFPGENDPPSFGEPPSQHTMTRQN